MKVAYLSQSALSDVDFSYIKEAQRIMDITYYILVSPSQRQRAAINLNDLPKKFGILPASQIPQLRKFNSIVDLNKVYVVNYTIKSNHHVNALSEPYKVYRELKANHYDVIHLTWPPTYLDFFIYCLKKKIVLTVHDPFPHSSQVHGIREFERKRAFKNIDHIILLNKEQKTNFVERYGLGIPSKHIYSSCLSRYDYLLIHKDNVKDVNKNQLVFFGQIFSHKGVDYLLEAMEIVHEQIPDASLIVAGNGKYWFDIRKYENKPYIDIQNRYIPDSELVSMISSSAIVVVPYIDATQSGVIMTAYAFNRPCIATNVGALSEMVNDGVNGVIIPPKNSSALAEAIVSLLQDPYKIDQYSETISREYQTGEKSWKKIAEQHKEIYIQVKK